MIYLYNPPFIIKKIFSDFFWDSTGNKILLTFDDGPNPGSTEIILKELKKNNIKSLFFCVGNNVNKYPELAKTILANGHSIGNHTYNHRRLTDSTKAESLKEIKLFNDLLSEKFNYRVKYFRPPHGKFNFNSSKIISESGMNCVMWSLLTYDYKNDFDIVKISVRKFLGKNSIVVLHDSDKSKNIIADSINYIVETAGTLGLQIGAPDECLK